MEIKSRKKVKDQICNMRNGLCCFQSSPPHRVHGHTVITCGGLRGSLLTSPFSTRHGGHVSRAHASPYPHRHRGAHRHRDTLGHQLWLAAGRLGATGTVIWANNFAQTSRGTHAPRCGGDMCSQEVAATRTSATKHVAV